MHGLTSPQGRISAAVITVATALAVMAAAAPRAARGAVVPLSQNHLLTARVQIGDAIATDSDTNSTIGPVNGADASVVGAGASAVTTLTFSPGPQSISGHLSGRTDGQPSGTALTVARSEGTFEYTFGVTEATPFTLSGQVTIAARYTDDVGRAELRLTEDGVRIGGGVIGPIPGIPGGASPVVGAGTLLPGHTYALTGSMLAPMDIDPLGNLEFSNADVEFTMAVPEPAAACLLAPAALSLLARRRRR